MLIHYRSFLVAVMRSRLFVRIGAYLLLALSVGSLCQNQAHAQSALSVTFPRENHPTGLSVAGRCQIGTIISISSPQGPVLSRYTNKLLGGIQCRNGKFAEDLAIQSLKQGQWISILFSDGKTTVTRNARYSRCPSLPGISSIRSPVNADYSSADDGEFCEIVNKYPYMTETFNFIDNSIYLADPHVLKIGETYYLTGTSDTRGRANFDIYRSTDLNQWTFLADAFSGPISTVPTVDGATRKILSLKNRPGFPDGRNFCEAWDPALAVMGNQVVLYFSAVEDRTSDLANCKLATHDVARRQTVFVASQSISDFVSGKPFADAARGGGAQPYWMGYQLHGNYAYDGGRQLGRAIPSTATEGVHGVGFWGLRLAHLGWNANTAMALAPFPFIDRDSRTWLLYNWVVHLPPQHPDYLNVGRYWNGNHIAGFPVGSAPYLYDVSASPNLFLNFANRANPERQVGGVSEGCYGMGDSYCVAEGPGLYWAPENGKYYFTLSRQGWDSPAYSMFYRVGNSVSELGINDFAKNPAGERLLTRSTDRLGAAGANLGGGMLFTGPGNRTYLVFHYLSSSYRRVYFKEITFEASDPQQIVSISPDGVGPAGFGSYLIPRP